MLEGLSYEFQSAWNRLWFTWRNGFNWRRGVYRERFEEKASLFSDNPQRIEAEVALRQRYKLQSLYSTSGRQRYLETLTYLEHLEALWRDMPRQTLEQPRWLDVGCKNWSYVEALYRFGVQQLGPELTLEGIELDGYRRYQNLYRRVDYARAFIQSIPKTEYRVGDLMEEGGLFDVVSCFLPFVFIEPCLRWGLPKQYFQPQAFLHHLVSRLKPGGLLLIVNQGQVEADTQAQLFQQLRQQTELSIQAVGPLPDTFGLFKHTRFGWVCQKQASKPVEKNPVTAELYMD